MGKRERGGVGKGVFTVYPKKNVLILKKMYSSLKKCTHPKKIVLKKKNMGTQNNCERKKELYCYQEYRDRTLDNKSIDKSPICEILFLIKS